MVEGGRKEVIALILFLSLYLAGREGVGGVEAGQLGGTQAGGKLPTLPDPRRPTVRGEFRVKGTSLLFMES